MLVVRGVNVFPTQIEEAVVRTPGLTPHFRIVLSRQGRLDRLTVQVEAAPNGSESDVAAATNELIRTLKESTGLGTAVEVRLPGTLERSTGKLNRVVDLRPHADDAAPTESANVPTAQGRMS